MCSIQTGELAVFKHRSGAGVSTPLTEVAPIVALLARQYGHGLILVISVDNLPPDLGVV